MSFKPNVQFIKTAIYSKDYPIVKNKSGKVLPEVAVVGRSNVGKSSLLNHLFHAKIVRTSVTPGKTQALNFFNYQDEICFADLPGYGYAAVPLQVKKEWGPMIARYLEERESLKLILFLLDIRRTPNEEDQQLMEWIRFYQKPVILVFTKTDKLNQSEKQANGKKILKELEAVDLPYVQYSVPKNLGERELLSKIKESLQEL